MKIVELPSVGEVDSQEICYCLFLDLLEHAAGLGQVIE
jgi:hypothetical protein